jgi:orotate phosphoribosyltransferase
VTPAAPPVPHDVAGWPCRPAAVAASALPALGATVSTAACAIDRSPAGSHLLSSERLAIRTVLTKDLLDAASSRPSSWTEPGHSGLA